MNGRHFATRTWHLEASSSASTLGGSITTPADGSSSSRFRRAAWGEAGR